jgi:hypothetical protein
MDVPTSLQRDTRSRVLESGPLGCEVPAANHCARSQGPPAALASRGAKMRRINWMVPIGTIEAPGVRCEGV